MMFLWFNTKMSLQEMKYYVSTVAGADTEGYQDGRALTAKFHINNGGIALDSHNNLLVADQGNRVIRRINSDRTTVDTLAGQRRTRGVYDGRGTDASFLVTSHFAVLQSGDVLVSDGERI